MNGDERFDQLLRAALEWQADDAARHVPSMERSVRHLAERLGPEPERARPPISLRADTGRGLLLITVLLLLALVAVAVAIGAQFLLRPPFEPPRFGFDGQCFTPDGDGIVYSAIVDDQPLVLYEDGRLISLRSAAGETRSALLETAGGLERRLSRRGIDLILDRVAETIPEPGCRHLRAAESTGEISVFTPAGLVELSWHPSNSGRRLTAEEEVAAEALDLALAQPETWLPADAWQAVTPERIAPERWLAMVELTPSGFGPGDEVPLSTGGLLEGSDPRYARVVLPGGQVPAEFGEEVAVRDGTAVRCGVLETADARRLSDSLDALPLAMHDEEELFTEDLTSRVFIYIATAYPEEPDCLEQGRDMQAAADPDPSPAPPSPTPGPADDLAEVDPCSLLPVSVDEMFGPGVVRERQASTLALGAPAQSCDLVSQAESMSRTIHATVTLYPRSVSQATAAGLALSVFGGGLVEDTVAGQPAWINECLAATLPCPGAIAAWSDPYLLVVEFDRPFGGEPPTTSLATARAVLAAVLTNRPDRARP
jgi:hypothetical protein